MDHARALKAAKRLTPGEVALLQSAAGLCGGADAERYKAELMATLDRSVDWRREEVLGVIRHLDGEEIAWVCENYIERRRSRRGRRSVERQ